MSRIEEYKEQEYYADAERIERYYKMLEAEREYYEHCKKEQDEQL